MNKQEFLASLAAGLRARFAPLLDPSAWLLIAVALVPLALIDFAMAKTLVQWSLYGLALAGAAVMISRIALPQLKLSEWVEHAREGKPGAALIVAAIVVALVLIFLSLILWAKT